MGLKNYPGSAFVLLMFDFLSYLIILNAINGRTSLFDNFIAFYLTMGFFIKLNILSYLGGDYFKILTSLSTQHEVTPEILDKALIASCISFAGILATSLFFRNKFILLADKIVFSAATYKIYLKHRKNIILFFILSILILSISNFFFGIYTKGGISSYNPSIQLFYKYFLSFGFTFFILHILHFELHKKKSFPVLFSSLIFFENMLSSTSQYSRAMILTSLSILLGIYKHCKIKKLSLDIKAFSLIVCMIFLFFITSFYVVTSKRNIEFLDADFNSQFITTPENLVKTSHSTFIEKWTKGMLIERWVGIEGIIAVSSSPKLSWDFFKLSLSEKNIRGLSFYDANFIKSAYVDVDFTKKQFVTLPGFIAYFFYSGSFFFLFLLVSFSMAVGYLIEYFSIYITSENYVIVAFTSNLIAYRWIHFGYMPLNTIQYFISIVATLLLYYYFFKWTLYKCKF